MNIVSVMQNTSITVMPFLVVVIYVYSCTNHQYTHTHTHTFKALFTLHFCVKTSSLGEHMYYLITFYYNLKLFLKPCIVRRIFPFPDIIHFVTLILVFVTIFPDP